MFNLMLITNDVELASYAHKSGVSRIFVDLEVNGKLERQGHLDTLISDHSIQDVNAIKKGVPDAELLVRLNPFYEGSEEEVESAIAAGADLLMLPMFTSVYEVSEFCRMIGSRVKCIPLVETAAAVDCLSEVVQLEGVSEIYIGLNDLHLDLGLKFMFELLANGMVESMAEIINASGKPFGFGGVARIGEGLLPAEKILSEHVRLGSSCVILSRTFHRRSESVSELKDYMCLEQEVNKILNCRNELSERNEDSVREDSRVVREIINSIVINKV